MLNVALVTTWGSRCGIATYSEELAECLQQNDVRVHVLAPLDPDTALDAPSSSVTYNAVWDRDSFNLSHLLLRTTEGFDVVHIQHEHGLFRNREAFQQALADMRRAGRRVVVTLHSVTPYGAWNSAGFFDDVRVLVDVVVVHTVAAAAAMSLAQGNATVVCIPHGTRVGVQLGDRVRGLEYLEIPKRDWNMSFGGSYGFIGSGKNIAATLRGFCEGLSRRLIQRNKGFIVVGEAPEGSSHSSDYMEFLRFLVVESGLGRNIFLRRRFVPRDMVRHVMAVLDYGVLNSASWVLSASGQVHVYASHGIPLTVANRPIYTEAVQGGAIPFDVQVGHEDSPSISLINNIASLAENASLRNTVSRSLQGYAKATGWDRIAKQYARLYGELAKRAAP